MIGWSESCRYCCKSPKLPGDDFPAITRTNRRPPLCVVSITLPRSPVSLSSGDEVPHIFTRKSRLQPGEFLISSAKRLLQQYLPKTDSCTAAITRPLLMSRSAARSRLVIVDALSSDGPLQIFAHELDMMSQHVQHACICGRDPEIVCLLL
jgi:hypothetical protein